MFGLCHAVVLTLFGKIAGNGWLGVVKFSEEARRTMVLLIGQHPPVATHQQGKRSSAPSSRGMARDLGSPSALPVRVLAE